MNVPGLGGLPPRDVLKRTWQQFQEDDVPAYAGSLAFHGMLALFPLLIFLIALVTFLDLPQLMQKLMQWAQTALPSDAMQQVETVLQETRNRRDAGLLSIGAAGTVWAASGGVRSAMNVLNQAYDVEETRSLWKRYALSLLYTLGLALLILVASALMLVGPQAVGWIAEQVGLENVFVEAWRWARYPVAAALLALATALVYSVLPNVPGFRWITPGAVLAVVLWILLSFGFQLYTANFGRYDVLYGSLGAVIVLLLYLWLSAIVLLVGGELNAVIDRGGRARERTRPRRT